MASKPPVAVYDAGVLYPFHLRNVLIQCAFDGLVEARWTDDIHDEWIRNLAANTPPLSSERLIATRDRMKVVLPDADGLELCQEWRGHPATAGTKIIFVSAFATRKDVDAALAAGADGYLPKSADTATLLPGHVARYLEQGAAAVAGATGGVSSGL